MDETVQTSAPLEALAAVTPDGTGPLLAGLAWTSVGVTVWALGRPHG